MPPVRIELTTSGLLEPQTLLGLDYETCALPTELKGRVHRCNLGIEPRGEARCFLAKKDNFHVVEKMGIDPIASCMLSTRSTI